MDHYFLFLTMATATVMSPGPGVTLTVTNSLRYGVYESMGGIVGIALGALIIAVISATGLGLILAASSWAFTIIKYVGAAYLIFLGVRMWRSPPLSKQDAAITEPNIKRRFIEGLSIQFSNPKVIFFFISIFPQFINRTEAYFMQFSILTLTYFFLVIVIHMLYAAMAGQARNWLASKKGGLVLNRVGGGVFILFGLVLAATEE